MKLVAGTILMLSGLPGVLSAQVHLSFPQLTRPAVRASVGPITLIATIGRGGLRVGATGRRHAPSETRRAASSTAASASAARVLAVGNGFVGTRYRYGGVSPITGFDCSGFVQYVFARQGITLPRTSRQQASAGRALPLSTASLRPGDLLFFASGGRTINHVAIYAGNNRILHSSAGGGGVRYDDLGSPRGKWYLARHRASRRVL
jgi:cell wall-associated NlpC family hydrolase